MTDFDKGTRGAFNTKHPPSDHAKACLRRIASEGVEGVPAQEFNFTVRDKLLAFEYVTMRLAPSDHIYKTHEAGRRVNFLFITDKGRAALRS